VEGAREGYAAAVMAAACRLRCRCQLNAFRPSANPRRSASCLFDSEGTEVGRKDFGFDSGERSATLDDYDPIPVSAQPSDASASCAPPLIETDTDGQGYVFGGVQVTSTNIGSGTALEFQVTWEEVSPPGMRSCRAEISSSEGRVEVMHFGLALGISPVDERLLPETPAEDITRVDLNCAPPDGN
jgi:hypothetical protein